MIALKILANTAQR